MTLLPVSLPARMLASIHCLQGIMETAKRRVCAKFSDCHNAYAGSWQANSVRKLLNK